MESNELTVGISHHHSALRHRSILNGYHWVRRSVRFVPIADMNRPSIGCSDGIFFGRAKFTIHAWLLWRASTARH